MSNKAFSIERAFNASVEKVWKAISNKDEMKKWYFDLPEFRPEKGFEFSFTAGESETKQYLHLCKITEVEVLKKLSYSWVYDGYAGYSVVSFELFPEGEKTKLRLTHTGLESFPSNNPDLAKENFEAGWTDIIGRALPDFLEQNK